jgi:hypothetical protein
LKPFWRNVFTIEMANSLSIATRLEIQFQFELS